MRFDDSLAFVLKEEGGFVDDPVDPGGATNKGITQRVYDKYRASKNDDPRGVHLIADDEVEDIYRSEYWGPCCCDLLGEPLDLAVFDGAVQHGQHTSIKFLQEALEMAVSGLPDPATLEQVNSADKTALAKKYMQIRKDFYQHLVDEQPALGKFLHGWDNRVDAVCATFS